MLRWDGGYFVPRGDGRYYLGATVEEQWLRSRAHGAAAYELLRDASELIPGALELELEEHFVGLRPGTPDNLPRIERLDPRTTVSGHRPLSQRGAAGPADRRPRLRATRRGAESSIEASRKCAYPLSSPRQDPPSGDLLDVLAAPDRGVAVAVDAEVVPRSAWDDTTIPDGARVEVLPAVQGG